MTINSEHDGVDRGFSILGAKRRTTYVRLLLHQEGSASSALWLRDRGGDLSFRGDDQRQCSARMSEAIALCQETEARTGANWSGQLELFSAQSIHGVVYTQAFEQIRYGGARVAAVAREPCGAIRYSGRGHWGGRQYEPSHLASRRVGLKIATAGLLATEALSSRCCAPPR